MIKVSNSDNDECINILIVLTTVAQEVEIQ